ncbi:lipocalin [Winogradskyella sp. A3E31]|uniref:lipocalin n=1 Tax=Winogradskyella sp. A3E31 TaxID=3349637 RepID=UPI00398B3085
MKKLFILILAIGLVSCGTSKTVRESKKVIKGDWVLNSVTSSAIGDIKITLLNDATKDCFENSTWQFIPNNNTGNYTLSGIDCNTQARYFVFTIAEIDEATGLYDFLLKPTNERGQSDTDAGFRLSLTQLSETTMQWQQTVTLEGRPITINMNFNKL